MWSRQSVGFETLHAWKTFSRSCCKGLWCRQLSHGALSLSVPPFSSQAEHFIGCTWLPSVPREIPVAVSAPLSQEISGKEADSLLHMSYKTNHTSRKVVTVLISTNLYLLNSHSLVTCNPPPLSRAPTVNTLDLILHSFYHFFILPHLTFLPLYLPLPLFSFHHSQSFPGLLSLLNPLETWTSTHCNNAIRQGDCETRKRVKVCDTVLTKQPGSQSLTAHRLNG